MQKMCLGGGDRSIAKRGGYRKLEPFSHNTFLNINNIYFERLMLW